MTYWRADASNNKPVRAGAQLTFSKEYGAGGQLAPNDTFFGTTRCLRGRARHVRPKGEQRRAFEKLSPVHLGPSPQIMP